MTPTCLKCRHPIADADVNVASDVAFCRRCHVAHKLSDLVHGTALDANVDTNRPPPGAWHQHSVHGAVIGATHRSMGAMLGALAISLFWNGIVSVFVLLAISATLSNLDVTIPDWFPAPKMNGGAMGVGETLFLWIFLTPFIVIGLAMIGAFLSALAGRTEVRVNENQAVVFNGISRLGWRRRFNPATVSDVRINDQKWRDSDGDSRRKRQIIIEMLDGKKIAFGTMLREERMRFVAAALRKVLVK